MAQTKLVDMTTGSPYKRIIQFAIPMLLGNLFQVLYNTVDSIIVGNFLGTQALAAVGAGNPFIFGLISFFVGLGLAATVMVSQAVGAKDYNKVHLISNTIYKLCIYLVIPFTIIGFFGSQPVLTLLNVPDDGTLTLATEYLQVIFLGLIFTLGYNLNAGLLQGLGDSVTSLKLLASSAMLNIVLDLVFVGPLAMGVRGAALATILAQGFSWIMGLVHINRKIEYVKINLLKLDFERSLVKESLTIGIPSALQNVIFSIGAMTMYSLINSYGYVFTAGFNGANKIDTLVFLPVQSLANATTTYVGQNVGAKNMRRVQHGLRAALVLNVSIALITSGITYPLSRFLLSLFGNDPGMIETGIYYLHAVLPFYFLLAILFTLNSALRGVGQATMPMISSMVSLWLARIPTAYYIANHFGKEYIYYAYAIGWLIGCILSASFFYFGSWRKKFAWEMSQPEGEKGEAPPVELPIEKADPEGHKDKE